MKKTIKGVISFILIICILSGSIITTFAAPTEVYLSDLRLVYADSYDEAKLILADTKLEGYKVLKENLNSNSGEKGVWLAYRTTLNVDDAITDIAVMQMNGGYREGNYQEMIKKSRFEYLRMGKTYLAAIRYFTKAYKAGGFLAQSAFRQLNFYTGLDDYKTERLGDIIVSGTLTESDLATFFLQGNTYVLKNVRSLISMGVSYNKDGMTYFEKVEESAELMDKDPDVFAYDDYDELAGIIADNIAVFRKMFDELSVYDDDLNYADDTFTEAEIKYSEYKAIAEMMRAVKYLGGKTLYEFCMEYEEDAEDYSSLYPLVDALNEGQEAMTTACCYYDVIRYSVAGLPEELINEEIAKLEQTYRDEPVGVYTGVDRSIYEETFALTSRAVRADAYSNGMKLADSLFADAWMMRAAEISSGTLDIAMSVWTIESSSGLVKEADAAESTAKAISRYTNMVRQVMNAIGGQAVDFGPFINTAIKKYTVFDLFTDMLYNYDKSVTDPNWTFDKVYACFMHEVVAGGMIRSEETKLLMKLISAEVDSAESAIVQKPPSATNTVAGLASKFTTLFYFLDAALLATSAIALGAKIYDYYHPTYSDIPSAMVDIVNTDKGAVYIKYDVVYEAEPQRDGGYSAADLNAFEGQRWNALYYTKSCEAGKPLLEKFVCSKTNNRAYEKYLPVHRFGEEICYDLNKYNFSSSADNIFLSVEQSKNQKSAVTKAPTLVGSAFGTGLVLISAAAGAALGIGGTVGVRSAMEKKKKNRSESNITTE